MPQIKILTICTGNKDRSPAMARWIKEVFKDIVEVRSAGISKYHTEKNNSNLISIEAIQWADLILCVSNVHVSFINGMLFVSGIDRKKIFDLNMRSDRTEAEVYESMERHRKLISRQIEKIKE